MTDTLPALPPVAPPRRGRLVSIGTAFVSLGTVMFFAGLLGFYLTQRASNPGWLEGVNIPLPMPNVMMVTLLMSVVTIQWAYYAIVNRDRPNAYLAMGLTLLFAVAFMNAQAYLYTQMGLVLRDSFEAVLIYTITGAYLAVLGAAMVYLAIAMFRALGGQYTGSQTDSLAGAVMFWYVVTAIYAVIWLAIYVTK
jgi:cytochrome c oxidase subunit 3